MTEEARDARISGLERRVGGVETSVADMGGKIDAGLRSLWKARESDRASATEDAERRHKEVMGELRKINGTLQDHAKEIVRLKTQREEDVRHQVPNAPPGKVVVEHEDHAGGTTQIVTPAQVRIGAKEIAYAGGGAGGVLGVVWLIWQILETVIEAVQAASGGVG